MSRWCSMSEYGAQTANVRTDITSAYQGGKRMQHEFRNWFCKNDGSHHLRSNRQHSNAEVVTALRKWLRSQQPDFYRDGIFKISLNEENTSRYVWWLCWKIKEVRPNQGTHFNISDTSHLILSPKEYFPLKHFEQSKNKQKFWAPEMTAGHSVKNIIYIRLITTSLPFKNICITLP